MSKSNQSSSLQRVKFQKPYYIRGKRGLYLICSDKDGLCVDVEAPEEKILELQKKLEEYLLDPKAE